MSTPQEELNIDRCPVVEVHLPGDAAGRVPPIHRPGSEIAVAESLDSTPLGQPAVVLELGGQRSFRRRLLELGFVPGTTVRVRNVAPLGDPLEIEIRGCRVSIRRAEAQQIRVEPVAEES